MFEMLTANPLTSVLMKDKDFVAMMEELKQRDTYIHLHATNPKLVQALCVLVNGNEKLGTQKRQRHIVEGMEEQGEVY